MKISDIQDTHICRIYGVECNGYCYYLIIYLSIDVSLLSECNYWTIRVIYITDFENEVKIHYNMFEEFHSAYIGGLEEILQYDESN